MYSHTCVELDVDVQPGSFKVKCSGRKKKSCLFKVIVIPYDDDMQSTSNPSAELM